jgi:ligand-binding sensor domain-containing protein/serine phosphatase RsbU (regulator of sigma subunit)
MRLKAYIFCWLFLLSKLVFAQKEYIHFDHLTANEGLSQNSPTCFRQDHKGLVWIGTQEGLNSYDGVSFRIYKRIVGDSSSLSDNFVLSIFESRDQTLWVGTEGGLNRFDRKKQKFQHFRHIANNASSLSSNSIYCIYEDNQGFLWLGTENGLNRFDPKNKTAKSYTGDNAAQNHIRDIVQYRGILFLATDDGLVEFDPQTFSVKNVSYSKQAIKTLKIDNDGFMWIGGPKGLSKRNLFTGFETAILQGGNIQALWIDKYEKAVWIGTDKGLIKYSISSRQMVVFRNDSSDPYSLSGNSILSLYQDAADVLWIGIDNGLGINRYDLHKIKFHQYAFKTDNQSENLNYVVRSIHQDQFDYLWIGTGSGLFRVNRREEKSQLFNLFSNDNILALYEDKDGTMWIGTENNGIYIFKNSNTPNLDLKVFKRFVNKPNDIQSLPVNRIRNIFEDSKGTLWIGTDKGGICEVVDREKGIFKRYQYNPSVPSSLSNDRIRGIFEDKDGDLWISTNGGGLCKMVRNSHGQVSFLRYQNNPKDSSSISSDRVYPLYQTKDGIIWVLTSGGGLNKLDKASGKFAHYTEKNGLPNNVLYGALADNNENLWFSTNKGISKFDPVAGTFFNYSVDDGLQDNEFNGGAFHKNRFGEMFFGGIKGLNYFFPDSVKQNPYVPPMIFTDLKVFNKSVEINDSDTAILQQHISETKKIVLTYQQNSFSIDFAALHYSQPWKNKYRYKMEGFDEDWTNVDNGTAKYTNIDAGEYLFRVRGCNADGVWNNKDISMVIIIKPAIWQTWWFRTFSVLATLIGIIAWYRHRVKSIEQQKRHLEEIVTERTLELRHRSEEVEAKNIALEESQEQMRVQALSLREANASIVQKNQLIEKKNLDTTASITYASRIQRAMLPSQKDLYQAFPKGFFAMFRPRDIVSGDFYWFARKNSRVIIAAIDCTGHGVPGAFMSMLADSALDRVVNVTGIDHADLILNELHREIRKSLKQDEVDEKGQSNRDGMDMSICVIDPISQNMEFAGAENPLIYIQSGKLTVIKGDRQPIGGMQKEQERVFKRHLINTTEPTVCYIFTDGFQDQFGGEAGVKFSIKRMQELFLQVYTLPMAQQQDIIERTFLNWKSKDKQIDDVLVMGFRV